MPLGEIPSTGNITAESAIEGGLHAAAIVGVIALTYLGLKAIFTGKNPLSKN